MGVDDCLDELVFSLLLQPSDVKSLGNASQSILQRHFVPWPTPHTNWLALFIQSNICESCIPKVLSSQFDPCACCFVFVLHSGKCLVDQIFFCVVGAAAGVLPVSVSTDVVDEVVGGVFILIAVAVVVVPVAVTGVKGKARTLHADADEIAAAL